MALDLRPESILPADWRQACLVGRAWVPGRPGGPSVVTIADDELHDITATFPTIAHLLEEGDPLAALRAAPAGASLGPLAEVLANSDPRGRDEIRPWLLPPCDLQALKACGVTFVASLLERVIEERAKGDPGRSDAIRKELTETAGVDLAAVRPGSPEAERLKAALQEADLWSQYLEVGIGPYAEVFTKAMPMSAVGTGADIGLHPESTWNNPEPEVVLVVDPRGRIVGATLGNDVNLRDFEGRSALLLGRAKDNTGSCAIGPFIRLLDETFRADDVRQAVVALTISGEDGFSLEAASSMAEISRDIEDLVGQTINETHQYPDGLLLFTGTMYVPVEDRGGSGQGFTHRTGDIVRIATPTLGTLVNRVDWSHRVPRWEFGTLELMRNLAARGCL